MIRHLHVDVSPVTAFGYGISMTCHHYDVYCLPCSMRVCFKSLRKRRLESTSQMPSCATRDHMAVVSRRQFPQAINFKNIVGICLRFLFMVRTSKKGMNAERLHHSLSFPVQASSRTIFPKHYIPTFELACT
jgi:hypothetical protein